MDEDKKDKKDKERTIGRDRTVVEENFPIDAIDAKVFHGLLTKLSPGELKIEMEEHGSVKKYYVIAGAFLDKENEEYGVAIIHAEQIGDQLNVQFYPTKANDDVPVSLRPGDDVPVWMRLRDDKPVPMGQMGDKPVFMGQEGGKLVAMEQEGGKLVVMEQEGGKLVPMDPGNDIWFERVVQAVRDRVKERLAKKTTGADDESEAETTPTQDADSGAGDGPSSDVKYDADIFKKLKEGHFSGSR